MILDRLFLDIFRLKRRLNARARYRTIHDTDGRGWPLYHIRAIPDGDAPGVPIVFLHGFGNDGSTWLPLTTLLGSQREMVAVDLPGFGGHAAQDGDQFTPHWYARAVSQLIRELTVRWGQPPILVGKSMGGMIAGLVACEIPELCHALVLIASAGIQTRRESPFWGEYRDGRNILLPEDSTEWETMVRTVYHNRRRIPGFIRRNALDYVVRNRTLLNHIFEQLLKEGMDPLGANLHRIRCPVTVVWGAQDQVLDPTALDRFSAEMSDVQIFQLEECGHSPTTERPERTAEIILGVLRRFG